MFFFFLVDPLKNQTTQTSTSFINCCQKSTPKHSLSYPLPSNNQKKARGERTKTTEAAPFVYLQSLEGGSPSLSILLVDHYPQTSPSICCCFQSGLSSRLDKGKGPKSLLLLRVLLTDWIRRRRKTTTTLPCDSQPAELPINCNYCTFLDLWMTTTKSTK